MTPPIIDDFPNSACEPFETEEVFLQTEIAFFRQVRSVVEDAVSGKDVATAHRIILGSASELVDMAADLAAVHRPGVRVVELGLLAERISCLALQYDTSDQDSEQND